MRARDDLVAGAADAIGRSALVAAGRIVRRTGALGKIHRGPARSRNPRLRASAGLAQAAPCEPVVLAVSRACATGLLSRAHLERHPRLGLVPLPARPAAAG